MGRLLAVVVIVAATLAVSPVALPCECAGRAVSGADALPAYDAVFLGYATNIKLLTTDGPVRESEFHFDGLALVTFRVRRAWKGVNERTLTLQLPTQGTACGDIFRVGQYYLVYARLRGGGRDLETDSCTPTKELSQAAKDIASLGLPPFQAEEKGSQ